MGKAYSEQEKDEIRRKIWEASLELFHAEDEKSLNIRKITEKAGISLGSFYHFYADKESLVRDIVIYRSGQKLDAIRESFPASCKDPAGYMAKQLYFHIHDMGEKITKKPIYQETFEEELSEEKASAVVFMKLFGAFLEELQTYWKDHDVKATLNKEGILDLVRGAEAFYHAKPLMDPVHFEELLRLLIEEGTQKYVSDRA